jgi:probable phosphoglycerate mutase
VTKIFVWRHGQTMWNAGERVQGHTDVDLNDIGRAQAAAAASRLAALSPTAIVSSDLRRAVDTATALADLTGLAITVDKRLRERSFGEWEGLTRAEIIAAYPDVYARWRAGDVHLDECGIETVSDLRARGAQAVRDAADLGPVVVAVTHGGIAKQAIAELVGWDQAAVGALGPLHNCHWVEMRVWEGRWLVDAYNKS